MAKPEEIDRATHRESFVEIAQAEVFTPSNVLLASTKKPQLVSTGVSDFSIEEESNTYPLDKPIPLLITINNKFCKHDVSSLTVKLLRCIKFRLDLGTGQECVSKSVVAQIVPTSKRLVGAQQKVFFDVYLNTYDPDCSIAKVFLNE